MQFINVQIKENERLYFPFKKGNDKIVAIIAVRQKAIKLNAKEINTDKYVTEKL